MADITLPMEQLMVCLQRFDAAAGVSSAAYPFANAPGADDLLGPLAAL
jgi:hypothetical protein